MTRIKMQSVSSSASTTLRTLACRFTYVSKVTVLLQHQQQQQQQMTGAKQKSAEWSRMKKYSSNLAFWKYRIRYQGLYRTIKAQVKRADSNPDGPSAKEDLEGLKDLRASLNQICDHQAENAPEDYLLEGYVLPLRDGRVKDLITERLLHCEDLPPLSGKEGGEDDETSIRESKTTMTSCSTTPWKSMLQRRMCFAKSRMSYRLRSRLGLTQIILMDSPAKLYMCLGRRLWTAEIWVRARRGTRQRRWKLRGSKRLRCEDGGHNEKHLQARQEDLYEVFASAAVRNFPQSHPVAWGDPREAFVDLAGEYRMNVCVMSAQLQISRKSET
jgi:hypothetical protein